MLLILKQITAVIFGIIAEELDTSAEAKAGSYSTLGFFCGSVFLVFIATSYYFVSESRKGWRSCSEKSMKMLSVVGHASVALGAFFYYVGENITAASEEFTAFGCREDCVEKIESSSRILLFVSLTCLGLLPSLVTKCWKGHKPIKNKEKAEGATKRERGGAEELKLKMISEGIDAATDLVKSDEDESSYDQSALASGFAAIALGQLVEVDAFYTAIFHQSVVANETNATTLKAEDCELEGLATASAGLGIIILLWASFIVISVKFIGNYNLGIVSKETHPKLRFFYGALFIITVIIVMLYPIPYFFGNESLPLACYPKVEPTIRFSLISASLGSHILVVLVISRILQAMEEFFGQPKDQRSLVTRLLCYLCRCVSEEDSTSTHAQP